MKSKVFIVLGLFLVNLGYGQGTQIGDSPIYYNNGNVGIGINNPTLNLQLYQDGNIVFLTGNSFRSSSGGFGILGYGARGSQSVPAPLNSGDNTLWFRGMGFDGTSYHRVAHISFSTESVSPGSVPGFISFQTNSGNGTHNLIERMRINSSGNIGIGTTSPDYKLDVLGTIRANEVKVATGWSDFVFDQDYDLPSLQEVENFINQNGHLPDIPSAEEVKADGISLGEMDAKLLQKIEELTLYVIELKKSDDTKTRIIDELQREIESLKKRNR